MSLKLLAIHPYDMVISVGSWGEILMISNFVLTPVGAALSGHVSKLPTQE